jgi:hypothetical protein
MSVRRRAPARLFVLVSISLSSLHFRGVPSDAAETTGSTTIVTTMKMSNGSPTAAQLAKFDSEWNGIPHRNICVPIVNGTASIEAAGMPNYMLYSVPRSFIEARELHDTIVIATRDETRSAGTVCLGIERL